MNRFFVVSALVFLLCTQIQAQVDSYPPRIAEKLAEQSAAEQSVAKKLNNNEARFIFNKKRWDPGSRVLVAFNGGSPALHKTIAEQAMKWTRFANVTFDFGFDAKNGQYRKWSPTDSSRVAHIRIGFSEPGYWSYIGTDSVSNIALPSEPTMNFQGFVERWPNLMPARWSTVVIHEFGHALGLHHEHQHPSCAEEFRWETGLNGEPSVYEVFLSWQGWKKPIVDLNLRPVTDRDVDSVTMPDRKSIMFYAMPEQAFIKGKQSPCFIEKENPAISLTDALGAKKAYPKSPSKVLAIATEYFRAGAKIANQQLSLTKKERDTIQSRVASIIESQKPLLYIHIQKEADRNIGRAMQQAGRTQGFFVPGIENVGKKGLKSGKTPEVRYFRNADAEYAQKAADLASSLTANTNFRVVKNTSFGKRITRNTIEIWLP